MNTCPNCCVPGGVTVMAEVPLCPSLVAVIVADPAATPVTSPLPLTVAAAVLLLCHVTVRPTSGLPFASLGVAVSCRLLPAVAVIVADPASTPVTNPVALTVAAEPLLLDQVIERPVRMLPLASFSVAVSCSVWPSFTVGDAGVSVTVATGAGGVLPAIVKLQV